MIFNINSIDYSLENTPDKPSNEIRTISKVDAILIQQVL